MRFVKDSWEALEAAEKESHLYPWMASFVQDLHWPNSTWMRELCIAAMETGYSGFPPDVDNEVQQACHPGSTLDNEMTFNALRRRTRHDAGHRMSRQSMWVGCFSSCELEHGGKVPIKATTEDTANAEPIDAKDLVVVVVVDA